MSVKLDDLETLVAELNDLAFTTLGDHDHVLFELQTTGSYTNITLTGLGVCLWDDEDNNSPPDFIGAETIEHVRTHVLTQFVALSTALDRVVRAALPGTPHPVLAFVEGVAKHGLDLGAYTAEGAEAVDRVLREGAYEALGRRQPGPLPPKEPR